MKKLLKPFIFITLTCTVLLGAGRSAQAASKVAINDTNFSSYVKWHARNADTNKDGYLSGKEASKVKELYFTARKPVESFKGIEYFTDVEKFSYRAGIVDPDEAVYEESTAPVVDLSGFKKLKSVYIRSSTDYLRTVNLQDCTNLRDVTIEGRRDGCVDTLNLEGCTNLRTIELFALDITKLNLSGFKHLTEVSIDDLVKGKLQTLNLKKCSNLKTVSIWSDRLTKLKLKGAKKLEYLYVKAASLTNLDLRTNVKLRELDINGGTKLTSLDLSHNTQLRDLHLGQGTNLTSLDLSHNTKLTTMGCYQTALTELDFRQNKNLVKVDCHNNKNIASINVKGCKKLRSLRFDNTKVKRINVKTNTDLRNLRCEDTPLTKLDVKKNTELQSLRCDHTGISKLNLKNNKKLKKLICTETDIRKLDLSKTKIKKPSALECDPDVSVIYAK